jgi:hypothetical protein
MSTTKTDQTARPIPDATNGVTVPPDVRTLAMDKTLEDDLATARHFAYAATCDRLRAMSAMAKVHCLVGFEAVTTAAWDTLLCRFACAHPRGLDCDGHAEDRDDGRRKKRQRRRACVFVHENENGAPASIAARAYMAGRAATDPLVVYHALNVLQHQSRLEAPSPELESIVSAIDDLEDHAAQAIGNCVVGLLVALVDEAEAVTSRIAEMRRRRASALAEPDMRAALHQGQFEMGDLAWAVKRIDEWTRTEAFRPSGSSVADSARALARLVPAHHQRRCFMESALWFAVAMISNLLPVLPLRAAIEVVADMAVRGDKGRSPPSPLPPRNAPRTQA